MLSIAEFQAAVSAYRKRFGSAVSVALLAVLTYFGILAYFRDPIKAIILKHFGFAYLDPLSGLLMLPMIGALLAAIAIGERWAMSDPRLRCPSCAKNITGISSIVTAARNCGFCGKRVLAEPEAFP